MRALTLTQPWAGLVASGIKLVENRSRRMIRREDFGVPFAIHASKTIDLDVINRAIEIAPELAPRGPYSLSDSRWYKLGHIASAVIAVATIADVIGGEPRAHVETFLAEDQRRWYFGPIGYVLRDVRALAEPVPCRGWQGFWTLPADVAARVEEQLR